MKNRACAPCFLRGYRQTYRVSKQGLGQIMQTPTYEKPVGLQNLMVSNAAAFPRQNLITQLLLW